MKVIISEGFKKNFSWWIKILVKIILSRIPLPYSFWQRVGIFRHGAMDKPEYAYAIFLRHFQETDLYSSRKPFVMLELGPGDLLSSGIVANGFGANKSLIVDINNNASENLELYKDLIEYLRKKNIKLPRMYNIQNLDDILTAFNIEYMTDGLDSLRSLESSSVDYLWTQSVLEHIRKNDFRSYIKEFRRILRNDGISVHGVDLKDHLDYGLNNLRFSDTLWESDFFTKSGFYTNRIRYSDMLRLFSECGFNYEVQNINHWKELPIKRSKLAKEFVDLSDDELRISSFDVILSPA